MTLKIRSISLVIALALAGCASMPAPTLLEGPTTAFAGEPQSGAVAEQWWRALNDPALDHLVDKALAGSLPTDDRLRLVKPRLISRNSVMPPRTS